MSETTLVPPPSDDSGAPGEQGVPATTLSGSGPQNAVAPGADSDPTGAIDDPTLMAPDGDPGGSASDLTSATDSSGLGGSASGAAAGSDPMPDPGGTVGS